VKTTEEMEHAFDNEGGVMFPTTARIPTRSLYFDEWEEDDDEFAGSCVVAITLAVLSGFGMGLLATLIF
jgi:hypothetical protein